MLRVPLFNWQPSGENALAEDGSKGGDRQDVGTQTCHRGHPLVEIVSDAKGKCDVCGKSLDAGMHVLECSECNWWQCHGSCSDNTDLNALAGGPRAAAISHWSQELDEEL